MALPTIEERFHGTCNLVILHLRRAAKSNDLETGFDTARAMGMLDPEQEAFIRSCFELDAILQRGETPDVAIDDALVKRLQACVLSLNTADPA